MPGHGHYAENNYRIRKYVIDLGGTANDLDFKSEGTCVVNNRLKKLVSNERSSDLSTKELLQILD